MGLRSVPGSSEEHAGQQTAAAAAAMSAAAAKGEHCCVWVGDGGAGRIQMVAGHQTAAAVSVPGFEEGGCW